jgi:hypothetical protein
MFAVLLMGVTTGCITTRPSVTPAISPFPHELYFETIGQPHGTSIEFTVRSNGVITRTEAAWSGGQRARTTQSRAITIQAWREFLDAIAPLNIHRWREYYEDQDVVDGSTWSMRLSMDPVQVQSHGSNAGPNLQNPARIVHDAEAWTGDDVFYEALTELWRKGVLLH